SVGAKSSIACWERCWQDSFPCRPVHNCSGAGSRSGSAAVSTSACGSLELGAVEFAGGLDLALLQEKLPALCQVLPELSECAPEGIERHLRVFATLFRATFHLLFHTLAQFLDDRAELLLRVDSLQQILDAGQEVLAERRFGQKRTREVPARPP